MIRRPPRSTLDRSSAASDVYKRQEKVGVRVEAADHPVDGFLDELLVGHRLDVVALDPVSYTHLRAHETVLDLVCRLLLEKKQQEKKNNRSTHRATHIDEQSK